MPKHNYILKNVPQGTSEDYIKSLIDVDDKNSIHIMCTDELDRFYLLLISNNSEKTFVFINTNETSIYAISEKMKTQNNLVVINFNHIIQ